MQHFKRSGPGVSCKYYTFKLSLCWEIYIYLRLIALIVKIVTVLYMIPVRLVDLCSATSVMHKTDKIHKYLLQLFVVCIMQLVTL